MFVETQRFSCWSGS